MFLHALIQASRLLPVDYQMRNSSSGHYLLISLIPSILLQNDPSIRHRTSWLKNKHKYKRLVGFEKKVNCGKGMDKFVLVLSNWRSSVKSIMNIFAWARKKLRISSHYEEEVLNLQHWATTQTNLKQHVNTALALPLRQQLVTFQKAFSKKGSA